MDHRSHDPSPARSRPRDPRAAFLVMLLVVVASLVTIRDAWAMLAPLAFVCAWHGWVARRPRATARVLVRVLPFAAFIIVLNAVLVPGEALVSVAGRRVVSREGLADGVFFALRLAVMLVAVASFLAASAPESMARGVYDVLRRFSQRAASRVALLVFLSMGFVPLLSDELRRIRVAQFFRGGAFSGGLVRRAEIARSWLVPLLVSAIHRSGELAKSVELRGIRERLVHTIEPPRLHLADVVLVAVAIAVVAWASA
ncbi:MAG TPA: energy-coupling factor transporter transmembrane component T [Candidatus Krumholzibacteria bacterium]|nr:energy-coupling factor transporter transmembrane component T [Candidatus Krumholzibacteria bacterium]